MNKFWHKSLWIKIYTILALVLASSVSIDHADATPMPSMSGADTMMNMQHASSEHETDCEKHCKALKAGMTCMQSGSLVYIGAQQMTQSTTQVSLNFTLIAVHPSPDFITSFEPPPPRL